MSEVNRMTDEKQLRQELLELASGQGIEQAELFIRHTDAFSTRVMDGKTVAYEVSHAGGASLRGLYGGKMGYAFSEEFGSREGMLQMVKAVKESAELNEQEEQDEIFPGEESYPEVPETECDLDGIGADEKLAIAAKLENAVLALDPRVKQSRGSSLRVSRVGTVICNSCGLLLEKEQHMFAAVASPVARDGEATATGYDLGAGTLLGSLDTDTLARKAVEETVSMLHAEPVVSGDYRVVLRWDAMQALLSTFSGIFSAENAQEKLSLLGGREGETIAAPVITLTDDPLRKGGFRTCAFDDEGSACFAKAVIERGVLKTLLHSRKTARKQGVKSTGNAARAGYKGALHVAPTNFYIEPGEESLDELLAGMGDGLMITDLSGLHAGANPVSGDFSLLSKGYVIRGGKRAEPVERVTIAGNFYQLLKDIRAVGSDLTFPGSGIGAPSVDAGVMKVSGK